MHSAKTFGLLSLLFLVGCGLGPVPKQQDESSSMGILPVAPPSSSSSSAVADAVTMSEPLENADVEGAVKSESTDVIPQLPERILENGVLEFGRADAPVILLAFTNHGCRYCADFAQSDFPRLQRDYIAKGLVRYDVAIVPFKKYPESALQAKTLLCAARQGKGLAMHQLLFTLKRSLESDLLQAAKALTLDVPLFTSCLADAEIERLVAAHADLAKSKNVTLVPTFVIGEETLVGLYRYPELKGKIEAAGR